MVSANSANSQLWNFGLNSPKLNRAVCLYVFPMILTVICSCACHVILERQISHPTTSSSTYSRTSSERMGVVLRGTFNRRQNCLGTLLKWDNFEEQINPVHARPSPLLSNLGCLLFLTCSSNSGTTLYGRGKGEWRLYFLPFLSWRNAREALLDKVSQLSLSPIIAQIVTLLGWEKMPWSQT